MLKRTSSLGHCSQQKFTSAGLLGLTRVGRDETGRIISICIQRKSTAGREIDVEVALGAVVLGLCTHLRVNIEEVACAHGPLINFALTHLASDPQHWKTLAEGEELTKFEMLFAAEQGGGRRRRGIQELFGIQERRAHRYLVRKPGENWKVSDNIGDRIISGTEPFVFVFDGVAVADRLSASAAGPFFTWAP